MNPNDNLQATNQNPGVSFLAIQHPNFAVVTTMLASRYGVTVIVLDNRTFAIKFGHDTLGYFNEESKKLFISHDSLWEVFLHEISHVNFAYKIGKLGGKLNKFEKAVSEVFAYSKNINRGFDVFYVRENLMYFQQQVRTIYSRSLRYGSSKYREVYELFSKYLESGE
jgi:hypothetical protein